MSDPESLSDLYRSMGDDPFMCSMFDCDEPATFFVAAEPCGPTCDHMHGTPSPMCAAHTKGKQIVATTGD